MEYFTFNNQKSSDLGVHISGSETWEKPSAVVERITVPGRNGELLSYTGAYDNVEITYHCGITSDFENKFSTFINFLASQKGYARLEDTYHPDVYRMATFSEVLNFSMQRKNTSGEFDIVFNCKPQSFLKAGETKSTFRAAGSITNPTLYDAKPLLRIYGTGTLTIGSEVVRITAADSYTDLDCDLQDAYKDDSTHNCNGNVVLTGDRFPVIAPGKHGVSFTSGISRVDITPRWWRL